MFEYPQILRIGELKLGSAVALHFLRFRVGSIRLESVGDEALNGRAPGGIYAFPPL
jgi:hypothetical protein